MFKATPMLSDGMPADDLTDIFNAAKRAVESSGEATCRFDNNGTLTPSGMYETWPAGDGPYQIVSYS